jgi:hypothetical protein
MHCTYDGQSRQNAIMLMQMHGIPINFCITLAAHIVYLKALDIH